MTRMVSARLLALAIGGLAAAATGCTDGGEPLQSVGDAGLDGKLPGDGGGADAQPDAQPDAAADAGAGECTLDADCDDGLDCTLDTCVANECVNDADDALCDDADPCTTDRCDPELGCQNDNLDCDDGLGCTTDSCDSATGSCINDTACDDGNECTIDSCDPATGCVNDAAPADGNACTAETGEAGTCNAGTCEIVDPTHYRMNTMKLVDPHILFDVDWAFCDTCLDITHQPGEDCFGEVQVEAFNDTLHNSVTMDADDDGLLDLSFVLELDPFDQTDGDGGTLTVFESDCIDVDNCSPAVGGTSQTTTYTTQRSGTCLEADPVTLGPEPWPDGVASDPNAPAAGTDGCFVSGMTTFTLTFDYEGEALTIPLRDAQVAGTYSGEPATGITDGLVMGFLSEQEADQIEVQIDGRILNLGQELLPEEDHGCGPDGRDQHNGELGWWFYINYTADQVANATGF